MNKQASLSQAKRSAEKHYALLDSEWEDCLADGSGRLIGQRKFVKFTYGGWHEITIGHVWMLGNSIGFKGI